MLLSRHANCKNQIVNVSLNLEHKDDKNTNFVPSKHPIFGLYCSPKLVLSLSLLAKEQMAKMASTRLAVKIFNVLIHSFYDKYTFMEL